MTEQREPIRHHIAAASHVGRVRDINQDRFLTTGELLAVADGMGGHVGGERASAAAIGELSGHRGLLDVDRLVAAAEAANTAVFTEAADPSLRGMGTTLVAAVVDDEAAEVRIVNVGDSRAYRYRRGELVQVTIDHSLVEDLVRTGRLTAEEAKEHPQRNIVTRVLGMGEHVDVDVFVLSAEPGDRFLLASDGLTNELSEAEIVTILDTVHGVDEVVDRLVASAVEAGGRDNVTVCLADIFDVDGNRPEPAAAVAGARKETTGEATAEIAPVAAPTAAEAPAGDGGAAGLFQTSRGPSMPDVVDLDAEPSLDQPPAPLKVDESTTLAPTRRTVPIAIAAVAIVTLLAVALGSRWYARSAWFATDDAGTVVIANGRPGGVLWWDPEVVVTTELVTADLDDASQEQLASEREWTSLEAAERFVENLSTASAAAADAGAGAAGAAGASSDDDGG